MGDRENMKIDTILSYLVHPSKGDKTQPMIGGVLLPLDGVLFNMLNSVFCRATEECNIEIASSEDGGQYNACRSELVDLLCHRTVEKGRVIAERLQAVTTKRSGLSLLFIIIGNKGPICRVYLSRFPADFGIVVHEGSVELRVELLEQVFMKNAGAYKAVVFDGENYDSDFWLGRAVDKQINNNAVAISSYWIREFLMADFRTTPAQGSRRLAMAIKQVIDQTKDTEVKEELAAAARLSRSLNGQLISISNFGERFGLSETTVNALTATFRDPSLRFDQFCFSSEEFSKHIQYRSLQISNGAMLTAPVEQFDQCFERARVSEQGEEFIFTTRGAIINQRLIKGIK
jgi:hypothetical protein